MKFQEEIERKCFQLAGNSHVAPAQRLAYFVAGKTSVTLPSTSYHPGISPAPLHQLMPGFITSRLQKGFRQIDSKARGFLTDEAVVLGVESRTSSPIRVTRNSQSFEHVQVKRLYPCGEGAGYSGGIVSSAIDGERCAEKVAQSFNSRK